MSTFSQNVKKVKDAFAAIKTALTGKGVTVPEDAKLSDVPALVESCGKKPLCTFELTYTDGTRTVETTSEGVVELNNRCYGRHLAKSIAVTFDSSAVFGTSTSEMFYYCYSLTSLTLPAGFGASVTDAQRMFAGCSSLTSLTLPEGFGASIGYAQYMFYGCSGLTSLTLPEGFGARVTDACGMFSKCSSLTSLTLQEGFGAGVTGDIHEMFFNCSSLTSLTLPAGFGASVTHTGYMFYGCSSLTSLTLPEGFGASIGYAQYMFYGCSGLTSLTLPEGFGASVTDAQRMFLSCSSLTQILAPEGVTLAEDGSNGILRMKVNFDLSSTTLDKDSLIRVIKSLQTVSSAKLILGTTLKAKLEGDDNADGAAALALATSKGWTIA